MIPIKCQICGEDDIVENWQSLICNKCKNNKCKNMEIQMVDEIKRYNTRVALLSIHERLRDKLREMADKMADELFEKSKLEIVYKDKINEEDVLVIKMNLNSPNKCNEQ